MIRVITFIALAALAACGADGEPVKPNVNAGVNISPNGVTAGVNTGARKGPLSVNWSLL